MDANTGWICPRCATSNAPSNARCIGCVPPVAPSPPLYTPTFIPEYTPTFIPEYKPWAPDKPSWEVTCGSPRRD